MTQVKLSLSSIFSDHMVLRQKTFNIIEGYDEPGQLINLQLDNQKAITTVADDKGYWQIQLAPQNAGGPHQLNIWGSSHRNIQDLYFGEVWLLGGQSNMELPINRVRDQYSEELFDEAFPLIRQFRMPTEPLFDRPLDMFSEGEWLLAKGDAMNDFSAIGYFYGRSLYQALKIPIGLIHTAVGGTPVEAWLPKEELRDYPDILAELSLWEDEETAERMLEENEKRVHAWHQNALSKDLGLQQSWQQNSDNLKTWEPIRLPDMFRDTGIGDFSGVIWLKRRFKVSEEDLNSEHFRLRLGTMINADETYLNGIKVGETGYRYPPRKYKVDRQHLRLGQNEVTVRLTIEDNNGGLIPDFPYQLELATHQLELAGEWYYKIGCELSDLHNDLYIYNKPNGLFNAVIAPLKNINISGLLFYQGESNIGKKTDYTELFCRLVESWRQLFKQEFPVYFVQLANYLEPTSSKDDTLWAKLRDCQYQASKRLNQVELVPAIDLGEWNELHPLKKKEVADRLSSVALNRQYGCGPEYQNVLVGQIQQQEEWLLIDILNLKGTLIINNHTEILIEVKTSQDQWQQSPVIVQDFSLKVSIKSIPDVKEIRYAWLNHPKSLLIDSETKLPLLPFWIVLESK